MLNKITAICFEGRSLKCFFLLIVGVDFLFSLKIKRIFLILSTQHVFIT